MTPFNLRSLLLAAIFLSNCISWTASRHHFTHNVNGHRSRHRRQGAGLFLSASYVLPGGEGSGWGEWGEVSPCSRTCGGGVASQKRICLQIGPEGQPQCSGGDTKYFSCQTQDCPAGSKDFRAEQCSEYDNQLFRDVKYKWVPYTKAPKPCELNCMPHAERFYYRHKEKVVDGTRCNDESFDVCVNGTCQPVGCDMMLGSSAKEDKCRVCVGNNVNCHTTSGVLKTVDLRKGYNDMLLIPEGATSIVVAEVGPSNNYLALRAKNGTFYLNGDYHIDFPRNLFIGGAMWTYERSQQGFAAPDKLRCLGPTNENLYLSLLLQDENVGINYEYSLPTDMAPPQNKRYNWVHDEFTPCSATCGGGFQTRTVSCRSREELEVVDEGLCDEGLRPPTNQSCNTQACSPQWVPGAWGQCSKRCGKGGTRSREVTCQKIISNGYPSIVADKECFDLLGPKPELFQECNVNATCPTWFTGPWKPCDKLCDEGKQTRQVVCYQKNGARIEVLGDKECEDERPPAQQACTLQPCDGVDWVVSPWNGCDSCLSKIQTRTMICATKSHEVVDDSFCSYHPTPSTEESCDPTALPPCETQWYATQWSNCSVTCGEGVQSRKVFCGLFDGTSVLKVPDARCAGQPKYNDTKPCEVPKDKCPSQWFAAPWSDCDKKCGGGDQTRRVMCLRGTERATDCDGETVPASSQSCNTGPCTADELLPVDSTAPVMLDDYEDCEEEEDLYSEVGLDSADGITPDDMMFSDASMSSEGSGMWTTSYAEMESNFTDTESTLSTDDLITAEGSGASSTIDFTDDFTTEIDITDETGSGSTITDDTESTVSGTSEVTASAETSESTDDTGSSTIASESSDDVGSTTEAIESSTNVTESSDALDSSTVDTDTDAAKKTVRPTHALPDTDETTKALIFEDDEIETVTTESEPTGTTDATESGATEATETTESEASSETTSVDASETTELGSTETTESSATETSETTESGSTDASEATESDATDITETTEAAETTESSPTNDASESGATETTEAIESSSTETSETAESGATATTEITESGPTTTETIESGPTETTEATETTESGPTETTETSESGPTETTESGPTETTETTESGPTETTETTESGPTETTETTESGPTEMTETTESGPTETTETTESGPTETTETTETGSTETTETTESGPTETTETTESGPTETTETTESGPTETTETTETGSTETTETTESGPTSETTEFSSLAPESTSESLAASTTEAEGLTSSAVEWFTSKKPRMCRPRQCTLSQFGCCPDKKTSAGGPFDEGCDKPKTCKQTKYGCCPDGLSPSPTPDKTGCPLLPCAESLFGCCLSDNKTAAEGNDQDGCPPPPPACKSSSYGCCKDGETEATGPAKEGCPETTVPETEPPTSTTALYEGCERTEFGCCFDNVTEATGPEQQGCPCDISQFGCCLDGVSPAQGPDYEGCLKSCKSSAYGCCPDGQTPAHGPNREGCCLRSAFKCCPDNYNYAQGPHFEGCGCQYSPYGCCPDNSTYATGYDNKGCGCSYSKHGCCPDGHTEATGPEFEGCACHTYQFGCCPDGITIARGSDGQGCHCLQSKYKCCGDGVTHAAGPNQEGCDCSSSKYGCCPDGRTEATGPKFQGCTDVPEDKQAACGLKFERGPCRNYSVAWYFDMEFGGCSRFWYGGCDGNGNRFASKEECDDTCVSPPPKEACKLPQSKGACLSYNVRWYYDSERESCLNFAYGGCLGNNNNFESRELCEKQCEPEKSTEQCNLPIERGPCAGDFPRWGFSSESRRCERFTWGGCGGNSNRFHTEAACTLRCDPPGQPKPECSQPQVAGHCAETEAVWAFSQTENRCMPFYYTGCEGNGNRFPSLESCESSCPSLYVPDKCILPYETGNCANYREKWYFDTKDQRCRQFYYGGCDGNENNFDSELECQSSCQALVTTTTPQPTVAQHTAPVQQARPQTADRPEFCFLELDVGPCTEFKTHYGYDYKTGRCVTFQYGGCGGNQNNFPDEQYCQYYCKAAQDVCQQPMLSGPCNDSQMRWFYDASTDSCSQFTYGGCEGNDNRFESRDECENRCKTGPVAEQTTSTTTTLAVESRIGEELPSKCAISSTLEPCSVATAGEVWFLGASRECVAHNNLAVGAACRATGVFRSQEACERSCGAFRGIEVCEYPLDAGRCSSYVAKYFYNATSARCEEFTYGGCMGGPNRFSTKLECAEVCKPAIDPCKQQPEPGNCLARYVMWYFDENTDHCQQFIYGGCGGNENRFETLEACEGRCRPLLYEVAVTTTTTQVPVQLEPKCVTPSSLEPCGSNFTVFYYDAETSGCRVADFGGCEYENSYRSEEECERSCGAFKGLDVCRAQMDPGPCRAAVPKFYFDAAEGECREFTYGGCRGGPNRFSTLEECEDNCRETGPAAECLEEVSTGSACGELPSRRWHYNRARGGCRVFAYQGCGGTRNNFLSYQECAHRCFVSESEEHAALCDRYAEECDTLQSQCEYDMKVTVAAEGCRRCECQPNCDRQRQQCETLGCTYGVIRVTEDGCESCVCAEDPCVRANCSATERCVASAYRDPATQSVQYTAHCVQDTDSNEVIPECEQLTAACAALSCRYGIQRTSTARGCVRCACVTEEVDCGKLRQECDMLRCSYGMERTTGEDGCERCQCSQHPCTAQRCGAGERCVLAPYRDAVTRDSRYLADCRPMNKSGECPSASTLSTETSCRQPECNDDADCRGVGKCCSRGCNRLCVAPQEATTVTTTLAPVTQHITTYGPEAPAAPSAGVAAEPEVSASEGGAATLRCIFHGNPPPRITWRFGELTIDSDYDRYRLKSDGALEIVSLVRNDSGVYVCVADNSLGRAQQEIQLLVTDPVEGPARIADEARAVTGELGAPLRVACRAYGHPPPAIYWYRGIDGPMVPYSNSLYEARDQTLTIRSLSTETLGEYACYAYNGHDKPATWVVTVQAYQPDETSVGRYLVPREALAVTPRPRAPPPVVVVTTPRPRIETTPYTVEVKTQLLPASTTISAGSELNLPCNVDGYPTPRVSWTKDGVTLIPTDTMWLTDTRLTIPRATPGDSGTYGCHAANQYSTHSSTVQITVQEVVIPSKCTDSPYFANCALIVQSKFCRHKYYSKFCCKSCVEAGQLDPSDVDLQADEPFRKK